MEKKYRLSSIIVAIMLLSSIVAISANGETVLETWRNPQTGIEVFVNPYNHDNSVLRGPEYQARILELIANGYVHKNYSITENSGGGGTQFGSYDEAYVMTTIKKTSTDNMDEAYYYIRSWMWGLSQQGGTPDGFYVNGEWVPIDEEWSAENTDLDDIEVDGHFEERWMHMEGRMIFSYNITMDLPDTTRQEGTIYVMRQDINDKQTIWYIGDNVEGILMTPSIPADWDDLVIEGAEEDKVRTIIYELPQAGSGPPQLQPNYYGVQILGTLYGPQSIDEIPPELLMYAIEINGQYYTYSDSPLDIWIYENIYKPNHDKSFNN